MTLARLSDLCSFSMCSLSRLLYGKTSYLLWWVRQGVLVFMGDFGQVFCEKVGLLSRSLRVWEIWAHPHRFDDAALGQGFRFIGNHVVKQSTVEA